MADDWPSWTKIEEDKKMEENKEYKEALAVAHQETIEKRRRVREEVHQPPAIMQQEWINNNRETVKRISGLNLDSAHCERSRNRSGVTYKGDGNLWKPLPEGDPLPTGSRKSQQNMNTALMKKEGD